MFPFLQDQEPLLYISIVESGKPVRKLKFEYGDLITMGAHKERAIQLPEIDEQTLFMLTERGYYLVLSPEMTGWVVAPEMPKISLVEMVRGNKVVYELGDYLVEFSQHHRAEIQLGKYRLLIQCQAPLKSKHLGFTALQIPMNLQLALLLLVAGSLMIPGVNWLKNAFYLQPLHPIISEIMSGNTRTVVDEDGDYSDWVEIKNPHPVAIDLTGYGLSDSRLDPFRWVFPDKKLDPGEVLIIFASKKDRLSGVFLHSNFFLRSSDEDVILTSPGGEIVDEIHYQNLPMDTSFGVDAVGDKVVFMQPTPGSSNGVTQGLLKRKISLQLNEVVVNASYLDEDKDPSDWIEIKNTGSEAVDLQGFGLADKRISSWRFPHHILQPGELLLVFASGKDRSLPQQEFHSDFRLSANETLFLRDANGNLLDQQELPPEIPNSWGRDEDGVWQFFAAPSPNRENLQQGEAKPQVTVAQKSKKLLINEVVTNSRKGLKDEFGDVHDWVEIKNISSEPVQLEGYGLSDKGHLPFRWAFPEKQLKAGKMLLVFLSNRDCATQKCKKLHASFRLQSSGDYIQLSAPDSTVIDKLHTGHQQYGVSVGRSQKDHHKRVLFAKPTPKKENGESTFITYTSEPIITIEKEVEGWQVSLRSEHSKALITYTTDGSVPRKSSKQYGQPFVISTNTVIRARAFQEKKLPSSVATKSALHLDKHRLPVISIAVDPYRMFDSSIGLYAKGPNANPVLPHKGANFWKRTELPVHLELFEANGRLGLGMDLGLRIFGGYSRGLDKKSFRLIARDTYGNDLVHYPLFLDRKLTGFKSFVLRTSGQDYKRTRFRDILMTQLIKDYSVDYQGYRTVVLYINGRYWGIYNLREKINAELLALHHGVNPDDVLLLRGNGRARPGKTNEYRELLSYVRKHNLSVEKHYRYVEQQMDVVNFADYWIFETYFANPDTGNIRYWKTPGRKWNWIIYDLDWGFDYFSHNTWEHVTDPEGTGAMNLFSTALLRGLLKNPSFKKMMLKRFAFHLNNTFHPDRVRGVVDTFVAEIAEEMPRDHARWTRDKTKWKSFVKRTRNFAKKRPAFVQKHLQQYFGLSNSRMKKLGFVTDKKNRKK